MQGRLEFQSAADSSAAARQAFASLRRSLLNEDVRLLVDEPLHLMFHRPISTSRSVLGFITTCQLTCTAQPGGYVLDYHARIKPVLLLLPLILIGALVISAITARDLVSTIMLPIVIGMFYAVYWFARYGFVSFLKSRMTIHEEDEDYDEEEDEDEEDEEEDDDQNEDEKS